MVFGLGLVKSLLYFACSGLLKEPGYHFMSAKNGFSFWWVALICSGTTLTSPSTVMKFTSPFQRGTMWKCMCSAMPAPATRPRFSPHVEAVGVHGFFQGVHGKLHRSHEFGRLFRRKLVQPVHVALGRHQDVPVVVGDLFIMARQVPPTPKTRSSAPFPSVARQKMQPWGLSSSSM